MQLSTKPKTGKKPSPRRGSRAPGAGSPAGDGWRVLLLEVAREILRGAHRGRPVRTFMDLAVRLSPTCLVLAPLTAASAGRAGRWISLMLMVLVVLLLLLAAVERWIVLPVLGGLRELSALLPRRREKPRPSGGRDGMQPGS